MRSFCCHMLYIFRLKIIRWFVYILQKEKGLRHAASILHIIQLLFIPWSNIETTYYTIIDCRMHISDMRLRDCDLLKKKDFFQKRDKMIYQVFWLNNLRDLKAHFSKTRWYTNINNSNRLKINLNLSDSALSLL